MIIRVKIATLPTLANTRIEVHTYVRLTLVVRIIHYELTQIIIRFVVKSGDKNTEKQNDNDSK
jgi:hypothetical protein